MPACEVGRGPSEGHQTGRVVPRLSIAPCLGVLTIVVDGRKLYSTEAGRAALVGQGVVLGPEADHERAGGCGMCCGRFLRRTQIQLHMLRPNSTLRRRGGGNRDAGSRAGSEKLVEGVWPSCLAIMLNGAWTLGSHGGTKRKCFWARLPRCSSLAESRPSRVKYSLAQRAINPVWISGRQLLVGY